ncbi:MAG: hypothetical protein QOF60_1908 [Actinomycetota bacterium]|jgi:hypothetical protein|nr:hypothetical protein [Actinomycetota bacterium]
MTLTKKVLAGAGLCAVAAIGMAAPAGAELAAKSNGVGVCISQVAIAPEQILGVSSLGQVIRKLGSTGDLHPLLDGARNTCGEPPGPGHLA